MGGRIDGYINGLSITKRLQFNRRQMPDRVDPTPHNFNKLPNLTTTSPPTTKSPCGIYGCFTIRDLYVFCTLWEDIVGKNYRIPMSSEISDALNFTDKILDHKILLIHMYLLLCSKFFRRYHFNVLHRVTYSNSRGCSIWSNSDDPSNLNTWSKISLF